MATIGFTEPLFAGALYGLSPLQVSVFPAANTYFRRGAFLISTPTGTIATPSGGLGALLGVAGPLPAAVTLSTTAAAGAPAQTYYHIVTYTNAGATAESQSSQEFVQNVPAGFKPVVTVSATGAPSGATNYYVYTSTLPQFEALQSTSGAPTALGTAFTEAYPLTNSGGVTAAASNPAANIIGFATTDSNAVYYSGTGGSLNVGNQSLFGATNSQPPLEPAEIYGVYAIKCQNAVFEMNLTQAWSPLLQGTTAGLRLDATTGVYVADTSLSNKILNIVGGADGVPTLQGVAGDIGKRIFVQFNGGLI